MSGYPQYMRPFSISAGKCPDLSRYRLLPARIGRPDGSLRLHRSNATLVPFRRREDQARKQEDRVLTGHTTAVAETTPNRTAAAVQMNAPTSQELLESVLASLDDDKAEDIVQIDLRGKSSIADYMVVASGRSSRQVASIAEKLADRLKESYRMSCKTEGKGAGDWVLIDAGDVIIHVFRPEVREFYQLEKMWMPATGAAQ
jgi:ribosome-associated protein